jgi:hypothetical protein
MHSLMLNGKNFLAPLTTRCYQDPLLLKVSNTECISPNIHLTRQEHLPSPHKVRLSATDSSSR